MHIKVQQAMNENAVLKKRLASSIKEQNLVRRNIAHIENKVFVELLVETGQVKDVQKNAFIAVLDYIEAQPRVVEFGEGDEKQPLHTAFKNVISMNFR